MKDSLISRTDSLPDRSDEVVADQFREWEKRGRGWQVYDYPVEIEPPFRPFSFFLPHEPPVVDDGQVPTFFSRLLGNQSANLKRQEHETTELTRYQHFREYIGNADQPEYCTYYREPFLEIQIFLPSEFKSSAASFRQVILSLSYVASPVGFEIVGNSEQIIIQFSATQNDIEQVRQQLQIHFPLCRFDVLDDNESAILPVTWLNGANSQVIVDFGLSKDVVLPLQALHSFEADPLTVVIGAMSNLKDRESAVFQVLFQKCQNDWADEFTDTIHCFEDTDLFEYLPDIKRQSAQKFSSTLFAAVIRIAVKSDEYSRSMEIVRNIGGALTRLTNPSGNELIPLSTDGYELEYHEQALLDRHSFRCGMLLNLDELLSLVHLPSSPIASSKLLRDDSHTKPLPDIAKGNRLILGNNIHQNQIEPATLSDDQRTRHMHIIGSSGSGKTTLLLSLIKQDMENGQGLCVIDPHGDLIDDAIALVPDGRLGDVVVVDPSDADFPIAFNLFDAKTELEKTLLSSDLVAAFRRMSTSWGDVMDSVLANAILAILASSSGGTLHDLKRFLVEKNFREEFLMTVSDDSVRYFWEHEFPLIASKPQASILIRLNTFLRQKLIRNIVCQKETKLNFRSIMDDKKILFIKLAQGLIGEENSHLLGTLLVSKLYQTALSRQDTVERPYFWVYMDEFHHFITPSMENILSGARKYNLGLHLSHQEYRQLQSRSPEVASSVLSNCYTRISFRLGDNDAEKLSSGFSFFDAKDLQNLGIGEAIARIERSEYDFHLRIPLIPNVEAATAKRRRQVVIQTTRANYARPKAEVEAELTANQRTENERPAYNKDNRLKPAQSNTPSTQQEEVSETVKTETRERTVNSNKTARSVEDDNPPKTDPQHRYLQSLFKRVGEGFGYKATVEKEVFGGNGRIDVVLESEMRKIACEISVTNDPSYELQNIQKCLAASFTHILMISTNARHLGQIRKLCEDALLADDFQRVKFLSPDEACLWLDQGSEQATTSSEKVKGFRVKLGLNAIEETGQKTKKKAISDVIFGAFRKLKNKPEE